MPTYENDPLLIDWKDSKFNDMRTFNIKSMRDVFFSLLNQSRCQKRVCDAEEHINKIWEKCAKLTEECTRLDAKIDKNKVDQ